jgi:hypothetical protein
LLFSVPHRPEFIFPGARGFFNMDDEILYYFPET